MALKDATILLLVVASATARAQNMGGQVGGGFNTTVTPGSAVAPSAIIRALSPGPSSPSNVYFEGQCSLSGLNELPCSYIDLSLDSPRSPSVYRTRTDAEGKFRVPASVIHEIRVTPSSPQFRTQQTEVDVKDADKPKLKVLLRGD